MSLPHPSIAKRTCLIGEMPLHRKVPVLHLCGRLIDFDREKKTGLLRDRSGTLPLNFSTPEPENPRLKAGDIVQVSGTPEAESFLVTQVVPLVTDTVMPQARTHPPRWQQLLNHEEQYQLIRFRSDFLQTIRQFFVKQDFIEIDAPSLIPAAGMEPHIEPFVTEFRRKSGEKQTYFLHTSPEFLMKKMLVAGYEKIFYLGHAFRNEELAPLHSPEFSMLEWYRAYQDYTALMDDCVELIAYLREKLRTKWQNLWRQDDLLQQNRRIISLTQLMQKRCGFDLAQIGKNDAQKLLQICHANGFTNADETWPVDDLFFLLFLEMAEPGLGADAPTIVKDYPSWMASLAKKKADDPRFVERFELYLDSMELANAFTELNDPDEQTDRLLAEQKYRRQLGRTKIPLDTDFIAALRAGMPPAAGIALGVDRLMMVFTNRKNIAEVQPFSF